MRLQTSSPANVDIPALSKILMSHAKKLGVYDHEMEDLVQNTFCRMYGAEAELQVESIVGYAIQILRNQHFRDLKNRKRARLAFMDYKVLGGTYTPPVNGHGVECSQAIALMDKVLSPIEKKDLILATIGYDYHERSAITGWPPKSTSTRTGMSRRKLAAAMG